MSAVPAFADEISNLQADFLMSRYQKVVAEAGRLLKSPSVSHADEILYLQGVSALKLRDLETADAGLNRLIRKYPASARIPEAEALLYRLEEMREPTVAPPVESFFAVQVGAFSSESNAQKLKAELERRGYPASVTKSDDSGTTLHKVRIGRYRERREAEEQAEKLRSDGFPAKVVP